MRGAVVAGVVGATCSTLSTASIAQSDQSGATRFELRSSDSQWQQVETRSVKTRVCLPISPPARGPSLAPNSNCEKASLVQASIASRA